MREWVVKFLGGFTKEELDLTARAERSECSEVEFYRNELIKKDQEIARLTNLMLTKSGFIIPSEVSTHAEVHQPINRKPSWPQRQRELEKEDARKYADEIERRWKSKAGAVPDVPLPSGDSES